MRHQVQNRNDRDTFLLALGQLWSAGVDVDWSPLVARVEPRRVSLPGYPFARQRHWVDPRRRQSTGQMVTPRPTAARRPRTDGRGSTGGAKSGQSEIEATLQRIWRGVPGRQSIGLNDNFFEIGGDSLIAIGVAMSATNQGLDLTPQDLYDHPSVSALAATLVARYAAGGLAVMPSGDDVSPPVPPNIAYFLEHGLRGRRPLAGAVGAAPRPDVGVDDVRSVLTAVTNHHDALRLRIVERAGTWEQHIGAPYESIELAARSLAERHGRGSAQEREAVLAIVAEDIRSQDLSATADRGVYLDAKAVRAIWRSPCSRWSPTVRRARSC